MVSNVEPREVETQTGLAKALRLRDGRALGAAHYSTPGFGFQV